MAYFITLGMNLHILHCRQNAVFDFRGAGLGPCGDNIQNTLNTPCFLSKRISGQKGFRTQLGPEPGFGTVLVTGQLLNAGYHFRDYLRVIILFNHHDDPVIHLFIQPVVSRLCSGCLGCIIHKTV